MGTVGTVTDDDARSRTYVAGQMVGELDHKLTIGEMPAHNHNKATASPGANTTADGTTSLNATGITINTAATGITDSGHQHSYTAPQSQNISAQVATNGYNVATQAATTGIASAVIVDPRHTHTINDPTHSHTITSNGGDQYHNNIQPTMTVVKMARL